MPTYSIVIPTMNAGDDLYHLLERIEHQTLNSNKETVIIDSGSSDQTLEHAKFFNTKVLSIEQGCFNHGSTRNLAIQHSKGECIFLFTQDALPLNNSFLVRMIESMEKYKAAGVFARQVPRDDASPLVKRDVSRWVSGENQRRVRKFSEWDFFLKEPPMQRYLSSVFDNVASLIRRDVWEKIPFPATPFGEDIEWAFRTLCNGYTIVYEPEAIVVHSHERSVKYAYQRTLVDHWRLYHLFGLRTIPTKRHLCSAICKTMLNDFLFLIKNPQFSNLWWKNLCNVPQHACLTAFGQYRGATMAARGLEISQSKHV